MQVSDKVTIITGASAGIGLATARRFAQAGARLVLVARSADKLTALAGELSRQGSQALALPADMRDQAAVNRMVDQAFERFGRIDILVNNAGQAAAGTVDAVSISDFRQIIELNLLGPVFAIQAVVPRMRQGGGGLILNISSMVSKMNIPGLGTYASTKAALNLLSDTARVELAPDNIRVITVFPRMTATDFGKNSLGNRQMRQHQRAGRPEAPPPMDTAEQVAERILDAAEKEPQEQYMDSE